MEKIIFGKEVLDYFDNLVFTLFEKDYFGFPESAENYDNNISEFVFSNIYTFPHKKTPKSLKHLGSEYIWYVFFEKRNQNYLITGILNNYSEEAKEL